MNKIILIGNLGRDPEMSYTPSGTAWTKFSLAVSRTYKGQNGERQTETEWFNIVAWNKLAEIANKFLQKGHKVYVEGRLSQRKYTDSNHVERTVVEVVINEMEMLTPKDRQQPSSSDNFLGQDDALGDLDDHPF